MTSFCVTPGTDDSICSMVLGQTSTTLLSQDRWIPSNPAPGTDDSICSLVSFPDPVMGLGTRLHMLHDPGTDFHYFTTPRQMASKQRPAPGTDDSICSLVSFPDPVMGLGTRLHMLHDPRTDFHYFTTPRQMASKQGPAPGTDN